MTLIRYVVFEQLNQEHEGSIERGRDKAGDY